MPSYHVLSRAFGDASVRTCECRARHSSFPRLWWWVFVETKERKKEEGCKMAYTDSERIDAIHALLEEREDVASLTSKARHLVTEMRRKFANEVGHLQDSGKFPRGALALFWKGENIARLSDSTSPKIESCLKKASATNVSIERWATATRSQIEHDLWTLWINQTTSNGCSLNERILSDCFDVLERRQSSLLCLMMWLVPEIKRLDVVEAIATHRNFLAWSVRDRMLFWVAYMRDMDCSQEKVRDITAQIVGLQLSSGAFAAAEDGDRSGDLAASAGGLLALIFCARETGPENNLAIDAVRQAVCWIVEYMPKANDAAPQSAALEYYESVALAYYALCEYIDLERRM